MKFNALARKAAKGPAPLEHGGNVEVEDLIRFVLEHGAEGGEQFLLGLDHGRILRGRTAFPGGCDDVRTIAHSVRVFSLGEERPNVERCRHGSSG